MSYALEGGNNMNGREGRRWLYELDHLVVGGGPRPARRQDRRTLVFSDMNRREASINDLPIPDIDRRIFGSRPDSERGQEIPLH